jgi:hypothetical protein
MARRYVGQKPKQTVLSRIRTVSVGATTDAGCSVGLGVGRQAPRRRREIRGRAFID